MTEITQADRLKPCPNPWCASIASPMEPYIALVSVREDWLQVKCPLCPMRGPAADSRDEAMRLWNTRPSPNIPEVGEDVVERAARAAYLAHHPRNKGWLVLSPYRRQQWAASARAAIAAALSTLPLGYKDGLEAAREALQHASMTFHRYAKLHRDKATDEGDAKACANASMAEEMDRALDAIRNITGGTHG